MKLGITLYHGERRKKCLIHVLHRWRFKIFETLPSIWYTWKFTVVNAPLNVQCPADSQNEFDSAHSVGWQVGDLLVIVLFAFVITGIL